MELAVRGSVWLLWRGMHVSSGLLLLVWLCVLLCLVGGSAGHPLPVLPVWLA